MGFGFDSTIEVFAAGIVVWQFRSDERGGVDEGRERRALRAIAMTFFALAAYVTIEAVRDLATDEEPATSSVGIALAAVSLLVMPTLALAKRRVGRRLASSILVADSTETLLCAWLSAILLVGLVLNAAIGWAWADPIAGIGIAVLAVREGLEAWRGDEYD